MLVFAVDLGLFTVQEGVNRVTFYFKLFLLNCSFLQYTNSQQICFYSVSWCEIIFFLSQTHSLILTTLLHSSHHKPLTSEWYYCNFSMKQHILCCVFVMMLICSHVVLMAFAIGETKAVHLGACTGCGLLEVVIFQQASWLFFVCLFVFCNFVKWKTFKWLKKTVEED